MFLKFKPLYISGELEIRDFNRKPRKFFFFFLPPSLLLGYVWNMTGRVFHGDDVRDC